MNKRFEFKFRLQKKKKKKYWSWKKLKTISFKSYHKKNDNIYIDM